MARKFLTAIDLNQFELQNARAQNLATAPATPVVGQMYYDTALGKERYWNGTAWINKDGSSIPDNTVTSAKIVDGAILNADINAAAGIALAKLAVDPLARGGHTGTQLAATISDFNTARDLQRLDQHAVPTASVNLNSQKVINLGTPTLSTDATNKAYVDAAVNGLDWKGSVRAATTANITLTGAQTVDGVVLVANDRVLVKNQTTGSANGLYVVNAGAWTRTTDADESSEVTSGMATFVEEGTTNGNQQWALNTDNPITLNTTALVFAQVGATGGAPAAGAGITLVSNTYDVGAGTGILVAADAVAIDTAVVVRKFAAAVGDGVAVAYTVTHNLGTQDVTVALYLNSGTFAEEECDVEHTTINAVTLRFAAAPAANAYRCVVHG